MPAFHCNLIYPAHLSTPSISSGHMFYSCGVVIISAIIINKVKAYHIISYCIVSYHTVPHRTAPQRIASRRIVSYCIIPCHFISYIIYNFKLMKHAFTAFVAKVLNLFLLNMCLYILQLCISLYIYIKLYFITYHISLYAIL